MTSSIFELLTASEYFDADWYVSRYPDVAVSNMTPVEHYITTGETLLRDPGPAFSTAWYLQRYPDVANAGMSPLFHFIRNGEREGRQPCPLKAQQAEQALLAGDGLQQALHALQQLLTSSDAREAGYATWALSRWYAAEQQWAKAVAILARADSAVVLPDNLGSQLLAVEALTNAGELAEAQARCLALIDDHPDYLDSMLAMANLLAAQQGKAAKRDMSVSHQWDELRLSWLNRVWRSQGLTALGLASSQQPLSLDNLVVTEAALPPPTVDDAGQDECISVIVPVYNAQATLASALKSLQQQTYRALEVIVVDDASSDASAAVARAFAADDPRFKVFVQPRNQGAYTARNRGLREARGDYFTVHDSDDWSHPQKLALQLSALRDNSELQACRSMWVRCSSSLIFHHWFIKRGWIYPNTSSLLCRRRVFEKLGYWDRVRVDADTEYLNRIRAYFGKNTVGGVLEGIPLALGRSRLDSLSQAGPTHLRTQFGGLRKQYQNAALAWHTSVKTPEALYMEEYPDERPFPAPVGNLP